MSLYSSREKIKRAHKCCQCYCCNKLFIQSYKQERYTKNCSGVPGVAYNFNNQNLISYQDNFNAKGNVPFVVYFDFETTAPTFNYLDQEEQKMFVVSYVMIVAFNPKLDLDCIIIQRSFAHSIEQLKTLDLFTREQSSYVENELIKMLKGSLKFQKENVKTALVKCFRWKVH